MIEHVVETGGERLDKFLVQAHPDVSRGQIQRLIKSGAVTVNGKQVSPHFGLRPGDRVAGTVSGQQFDLSPAPSLAVPVVFENDDLLVVEKPAGLLVHPAPGVTGPTLVNWLLARVPAIASVGDDRTRPGIVHRLDADASGLLVVAKTAGAFEHLRAQFAGHSVDKEYLVLVNGRVARDEGAIDLAIGRTPRGKLAAGGAVRSGREAHTAFTVLERFARFTLLSVKTTTGRTNQIRVHLKTFGHSVAGDPVYRTRDVRRAHQPGRLFLHATRLGFLGPDHQYHEFTSELPADLAGFLEKLSHH